MGLIRENSYGPEARQKRREAIKVSLDKVLEKIREIAEKSATEKSADGNYIYRGEPKCYDKVSSSLYRQNKDIEVEEFDIEAVEKELLKEAKQYTHQTDDFEIMSELQHYGGATNLIDFTTDYLIALFFACDGEHNENGRVILLQRSDDMNKHIWRPRIPNNRVIAQKSIFVQPKKGFIEPEPDAIICIPKDLKRSILDHLGKYHGISTETIYNDLHGFITTQRIHQRANKKFYRGITCQDQGNNEGAIEYYNRAIKLKPDFTEAYNNRGVAYGSKGDFDHEIQDYTKAIELNPNDAEAYYNRGVAYGNRDDFDQAIQEYNKAIDLKPDYAGAYNNRGIAYDNKGDFDQAIQDYTKAIELSPNDAEAYNNRGATYGNRDDFDQAIKDFGKAIDLKPDYVEAYINRGNAYSNKDDFDQAIKDYNKVIELKPDFTDAYNSRGNAYSNKGDFDQAIQDYNKAIELKPDFADAYFNRGDAYIINKGDLDQAIQDYNEAIELKPDFAEAYFNRVCTWLHLGKWKKAKADLTTAKDMGVDIAAMFRFLYGSVADFEREYDLALPEDIADMLTGESV